MSVSWSPAYRRYRIDAKLAPDVVTLPPRFRVRVRKGRLVRLVLEELVEARFNLGVALDRPCVYGVFSRPLGGLTPREELCVGCLRCTVQYPEVVQILPNPDRRRWGGSWLQPEQTETILYEARTGRVPVRGAGYRGGFGGTGWDGMWLDMSEIVRPTRDGIHGREHISTAVDIGEKPRAWRPDEWPPAPTRTLGVQVPFLFDSPPPGEAQHRLIEVLVEAAGQLGTLAIVPLTLSRRFPTPHAVPLVGRADFHHLGTLGAAPALMELDGWEASCFDELRRRFPQAVIAVRVGADADVLQLARQGARVLHLAADPRSQSGDGFIGDLVRRAHGRLVDAGLREEVTLIGGGGIVMAEHVPKAIACGLDAVSLDLALWTALQGRLTGDPARLLSLTLELPRFSREWGIQRVKNLAASWRDQLLEVLGAMGLRDVRRLRGELGRCMFQADLEAEAFSGIQGYAG